MQFAFELQQTRLHAEQVVALTLLEVRVAAFEQELAHFQIVVGVILIADAHGQNVYLLEAFHERAFPAQSKHFHQRFLSVVAGILGSSLALGYPHTLLFVQDGIMNIGRKHFCVLQTFAQR